MKSNLTILLILLTHWAVAQLYPVCHNRQWGYIDQWGKMAIASQFADAHAFRGGLAAVATLNGMYGYIDSAGQMVIIPQFDRADCFIGEEAIIWVGEKPFFINKKGEKLFDHDFALLSPFNEYGLSIVEDQQGKKGAVNKKGEIVIKPQFTEIQFFSEGIAIASHSETKTAVNLQGEAVLSGDIRGFHNGFFVCSGQKSYKVLDRSGKEVFADSSHTWSFLYSNYFEYGVAPILFYIRGDRQNAKVKQILSKTAIPSIEEVQEVLHEGIINAKGEIICEDSTWQAISPFYYDRAFVRKDSKWFLINQRGQRVGSKQYQRLVELANMEGSDKSFDEGIRFVVTAAGVAPIDTTGNFLVPPIRIDTGYEQLGRILLLTNLSEEEGFIYGWWNFEKQVVVLPRYSEIDITTLHSPLIKVKLGEKEMYVNQKGEKIAEVGNCIVDMPKSSYEIKSKQQLVENHSFQKNQLQLMLQPKADTIITIYLVNTTSKAVQIVAEDLQMHISMQALSANGVWKDIEAIPYSGCGNSRIEMPINPNTSWEFTHIHALGSFKTKLRAKILTEKGLIYSNEIDGSINVRQFWQD